MTDKPVPGTPGLAPEDAELVRQVLNGHTDAFGELVRRYQSKIYMMALYHTRQPSAAEDVVQEVFLAVYKSLGRFDQARSFTNWILKIATNHCYKAIRRRPAIPLPDRDIPVFCDPLDDQLLKERQEAVGAALAKLPEDFRLVVWLYYFFERSYQQIADILEIPLHLVKIRLFRAKRSLGQALRQSSAIEPELPLREVHE
ncbi:MAG TPA: sigma-70 family RNA polymerase sigma factor [Candidatus Ozemobacteraceae bacterium]|nr:sigma-70 family RNA polymerase sigma factor [Candidatus Ozemobacteraceae bacterium]